MIHTPRTQAYAYATACCALLLALPTATAQEPTDRNGSLLAAPERSRASANTGTAVVVRENRDAVVNVFVEVQHPTTPFKIERPSSGVIIDPSGIVLTLWSLIEEAPQSTDKQIIVRMHDEERTRHTAKVLARDPAMGLALLQIQDLEQPLPFVKLANSGKTLAGTPSLVLACPDDEGHIAFAGVCGHSLGDASLDGATIAAADMLLTDARIDRRCHGAALLGPGGELLGLCSADSVRRDQQEPTLQDLMQPSFGFAIAADRIREAFRRQLATADFKNKTLQTAPKPSRPTLSAEAVASVRDSIVSVLGSGRRLPSLGESDPYATQRRERLGSGVVLSRSGLVVTNNHLVGEEDDLRITLADGRSFGATVLRRRPAANLALLELDLPAGAKVPAAPCGTDADLTLGEPLLGVGNPLGETPTVTGGVLSARRRGGRLQADPNLGNQNAGGALIDRNGRVVGIIDGGVIDPVELAYRMRGDEAKKESNLSTCLGIDAVRDLFRTELESVPASESIRSPLSKADADRQATRAGRMLPARVPEDKVIETVARTKGAMLNIYVSWTSAEIDEQQNPFAAVQEATVQGHSLGSGVIIDPSGLALTNWHVVDDATEPDGSMRKDHVVHARLFDGRKLEAQVLSISREDDLALLQLVVPEGQRLTAIKLGDSEKLAIGEIVMAIGNPHGYANTITAGIVTAKDQGIRVRGRWAKLENLIETDAAINGGNSGGALIDLDGHLIGINSAGSGGLSARGYAIDIDHVRRTTLELLLSPEKLRSPNLGCRVGDKDGAVVVTSVVPGGPADRAGVAIGDRVAQINGVDPAWSPGFAMLLLATAGKAEEETATLQPVRLTLERSGNQRTVEVTPMSAAAWAIRRQSGLDIREVSFRDEPETVREAWVATHRHFTRNPQADPHAILDGVLRVERCLDDDQKIQPGDLLLGAEFATDSNDGDAFELLRFGTAAEAQRCFNDPKRSSYEGKRIRCWVLRNGQVEVVDHVVRRLLP